MVLASSYIYLEPVITGLITVERQFNYSDSLNLVVDSSSEYNWNLEQHGSLMSVKLNGKMENRGYAKVYVENNNEKYLIFDSNLLEEWGIVGITGLVIGGEEGENITETNNPPVWNSSVESFVVNENLEIDLSDYFYDEDNDSLSYSFDSVDDLEILISDSILIINNKNNMVGNKILFVYAIDNETSKAKDVVLVLLNTTITNETIVNETVEINETGAPVWISDKRRFIVNRSLKINLDEYFYDPEDDEVIYAASEVFGLTIKLNDSIVSINNEDNIVGNKTLRFVASDGWNKKSINVELVLVNWSYVNITEIVNESVEINESVINETVENITISKAIDIRLDYKTGSVYDVDDNGIETKMGVIDFTVENTRFNFSVDESKLCTKWGTYSLESEEETIVCYGSSDCCGLVNLVPIRENWKEAFYSYYGQYGAGLENIISAQITYYNMSLEGPYVNVVYSDWANLSANYYKGLILFEDVCVETCALFGFNSSSYKLIFEINDTVLTVDEIKYSITKEVSIANNPPILLKNIPNISINKNYTIDLSEYFYDEDGDELSYSYYKTDNISIVIEGNIATMISDKGFTGRRYMFFKANDFEFTAVSNVFRINVTDQMIVRRSEIVNKTRVVINRPVRWIKNVNLDTPKTTVVINLTSGAKNITVRKIVNGLREKIIHKNIKVKEEGVVKDLEEYEKEKKSKKGGIGLKAIPTAEEVLSSITGMFIALTGFAVEEGESVTETDFTELIINETVKDVEIEYYTEGPVSTEKNISLNKKRIIISSDIHYEDVLAYTFITESPADAVKLYLLVNNSRIEVSSSKYDTNYNGLVDYIEWNVPSLSNQTYEVEITILNVQSYPTVGGNWTVRFETNGVANLTISAVDGTSYAEVYGDNILTRNDLGLLELKCGNSVLFNKGDLIDSDNVYLVLENTSLVKLNETINESLKIKSIFVEGYNCSDVGYHTVKVLTPGIHNQLFEFSGQNATAHNFALNETGYKLKLNVITGAGTAQKNESGYKVKLSVSHSASGFALNETGYDVTGNVYAEGVGGGYNESEYKLYLVPEQAFYSHSCAITPNDPSCDSCSCPISGDWSIDCADHCVTTRDCNMQGNSISATGSGSWTINALVYNFDLLAVHGSLCQAVCIRAEGCFG